MGKLMHAIGAGLLCLVVGTGGALANVVVSGTRVVLPAATGEVTVRLSNEGTEPALVQAWIDRGNPQSTPDQIDVPFLITPPLFRLDPRQGQSLRIVYTREPLPTDRESLFWLNVLEVPPKPTGEAAAGNMLQLAIRSRLKLFFRPGGLRVDPLKAPGDLTWKAGTGTGAGTLDVANPTPYYVTLSAVSVVLDGQDHAAETGMVPPFGTLKLAVPGTTSSVANANIAYTAINDYGAAAHYQAVALP